MPVLYAWIFILPSLVTANEFRKTRLNMRSLRILNHYPTHDQDQQCHTFEECHFLAAKSKTWFTPYGDQQPDPVRLSLPVIMVNQPVRLR